MGLYEVGLAAARSHVQGVGQGVGHAAGRHHPEDHEDGDTAGRFYFDGISNNRTSPMDTSLCSVLALQTWIAITRVHSSQSINTLFPLNQSIIHVYTGMD